MKKGLEFMLIYVICVCLLVHSGVQHILLTMLITWWVSCFRHDLLTFAGACVQEWIIQRKLQHCVQKTQDDDRQSTTQTKKKSNTNVNKNRGAHRHPQR
jgi:hypothetical protein